MPRTLVVQTAFLGDVVLTTPLIEELATRGSVDVVTTPAGAGLLAGHPAVRRIIPFDKHDTQKGIAGLVSIIRAARSESPSDTAVLAQRSVRSAAVALLAGYKRRTGFEGSPGRILYTDRIPFDRSLHQSARLLSLSGRITDRNKPPRPRLYPSPANEAEVDQLLQGAGAVGEPLIGIAPGGVWGTKRWVHYDDLVGNLADLGRVVIIGGGELAESASRLVSASGGRAIDASGRLSLLASAALIGRCRVLVTNDSAPLHIASAMNTPTVGVYGPTDPVLGFYPLADHWGFAGLETLGCRPCHHHGPPTCPLGHFRCMRNLTAEAVEAVVRRVVAEAA
ncbi:MAG: glycosyltransferase family 9 protein [Gemmatimonadota bacterium]